MNILEFLLLVVFVHLHESATKLGKATLVGTEAFSRRICTSEFCGIESGNHDDLLRKSHCPSFHTSNRHFVSKTIPSITTIQQ